jgi:hypothetical protein
MTILEALVQLRDDIKTWCINNFNNVHQNVDTLKTQLQNGDITVQVADVANMASSADNAYCDGDGKVINTTYETKSDATTKLNEAKQYANDAIENINLLDARVDGAAVVSVDDHGIFWNDTFMLGDPGGYELANGEIRLHVPIVAGDNITITQDSDDIIKINAGHGMPDYSQDNNGQFLRIIDGAPAWVKVANADISYNSNSHVLTIITSEEA